MFTATVLSCCLSFALAFAVGFVFKPDGLYFNLRKGGRIPESARCYSGSALSYGIIVLSFFIVYSAMIYGIYSKPGGYVARGLSFATFVIPTFAAFGAYKMAGIAGIKFRWRERWAPAEIERLDRWRENLTEQDRSRLSMYMKAARLSAMVALVACAAVSFAIVWSFAANQSRLQQRRDQVVQQNLHRRARTRTLRKNQGSLRRP